MSTGFVSIKRIFKDKNLFLCRWIDSPNIEMHVQGSITHKSEKFVCVNEFGFNARKYNIYVCSNVV